MQVSRSAGAPTLLLLLLFVGACAAPGRSEDARTEALEAIGRWEEGWRIHDAELAARDYSEDADWTNAFGMRRIGRADIQALLEQVFAMPAVMAGATTYEYHDVERPGSDTLLVRSRAIRAGQQLVDGTPEERHINHLRVFSRRDGEWRIVAHLISDERTPGAAR